MFSYIENIQNIETELAILRRHINSLPEGESKPKEIPRLPFGAQYNLIGFRKPDNSLHLTWDSMTDRYYRVCSHSVMESYFYCATEVERKELIQSKVTRDAMLNELTDFNYKASYQEQENLLQGLLTWHLVTIMERKDNALSQPPQIPSIASASLFVKNIGNVFSGKQPEKQQVALHRLQGVIADVQDRVNNQVLHEGLLDASQNEKIDYQECIDTLVQMQVTFQQQALLTQQELKSGKVVNLCNAWYSYIQSLSEECSFRLLAKQEQVKRGIVII